MQSDNECVATPKNPSHYCQREIIYVLNFNKTLHPGGTPPTDGESSLIGYEVISNINVVCGLRRQRWLVAVTVVEHTDLAWVCNDDIMSV